MKKLEIDHARKLGEELGAEGVIIIALSGNRYSGASWGKTKHECGIMKILLNALCEQMLKLLDRSG